MFVNRVHRFSDLRKKVPFTPKGDRFIDVFKLAFNDDGTKELIVCGKKDIYAEIQSHKESCDLHIILERCLRNGDMSELHKVEGFYGDMTVFPKTRAEALQSIAEAENVWKKLPAEVKEKFDNNVDKFYSEAFSDEWFEKLQIKQEKKVEPVIKEEKEEGAKNE